MFRWPGYTIPGTHIEVNLKTGEGKVTVLGEVVHNYTMNGGVFSGRDQRELIAEAIAWWETQPLALEETPGLA